MADSYLRLAVGVLSGIALLMFLIGYGIGTWTKSIRHMMVILGSIGIGLLVILLLVMRVLSVSGSLIDSQIFAFWVELNAALAGGGMVGRWRKPERNGALLGAGIVLIIMSVLAIGVQVRNVHAVLDVLESAGVLKPRDDYKPETNKDCPANLQSLYNAFEQYAEFNDSLPPAANWEENTDLTARIPQDEWLHCPLVSNRHDDKFGYAYNEAVAGKKLNLKGKPLKTLPNAVTTPLLYDSTNLKKNAHDAFSSQPKPGRHGGRNNVLYLDGHVAAVASK